MRKLQGAKTYGVVALLVGYVVLCEVMKWETNKDVIAVLAALGLAALRSAVGEGSEEGRRSQR